MSRRLKKVLSAALTLCLCIPTAAAPVFGATGENETDVEVKALSSIEAANYQTEGEEMRAVDALGDLPLKFDLRDEGIDRVTSVKSQNPFGTCWAFGSSAAAEISILSDLDMTNTDFVDKYGKELDLSEKHLAYWAVHPVPEGDPFDPTQIGEGCYTENMQTAEGTYDEGGDPFLCLSLYNSGVGPVLEWSDKSFEYKFYDASGNVITNPDMMGDIVDWELDPLTRGMYNFQLKDGYYLPIPVKKHKGSDGKWVYDGYNESGTAAAKQEIYKGRGVAVHYRADTSKPGQTGVAKSLNTETWAQYDDVNLNSNHVVCIVGWDDTYPKENFLTPPPGDGAWIVKNSWGEGSWGIDNSGYFYLSYYDHSIKAWECFDFDLSDRSFIQNVTYDQYDLLPSIGGLVDVLSFEASEKTLRMANVFTVKSDQDLYAAGVTTVYPNSRVTIEVYRFDKGADTSDPAGGQFIDRKVMTFERSGFHRVELNGTYSFRQGDKYSIVVKEQSTDTDGLKYVVHSAVNASKGVEESSYSVAVVNPGESFVDMGDSAWKDWSEERLKYSAKGAWLEGFEIDNFPIKGIASPVLPQTPENVKAKGGKGSIKVSWKKVKDADGYCIHYGTDENLTEQEETDVKKSPVTIKKFEKKTTYYVQVEAYKLDENGRKLHSEASDVIKVKTK